MIPQGLNFEYLGTLLSVVTPQNLAPWILWHELIYVSMGQIIDQNVHTITVNQSLINNDAIN